VQFKFGLGKFLYVDRVSVVALQFVHLRIRCTRDQHPVRAKEEATLIRKGVLLDNALGGFEARNDIDACIRELELYTVSASSVLRDHPRTVARDAGSAENVFAFCENCLKLISMNVFYSSNILESRCEVVAT